MCDRMWRSFTSLKQCPSNCGKYSATLSSRLSFPASASFVTAAATNVFVIEHTLSIVLSVIGRDGAIDAFPNPRR